MNLYVYRADIYCPRCAGDIKLRLRFDGLAPANPDDEETYDSDDFPKGPYPIVMGEFDDPECADCGVLLNN